MTPEQRITLTEHEAASISATGIWFEIILMQMLIRDAYKQDPASPHFQFALTEIADECRHSTMFAKAAEHFGIQNYGPPLWIRTLARPFKALASGSLAFGGTLAAEEILDMMQRDFMKDDRVQPVTRTVRSARSTSWRRRATSGSPARRPSGSPPGWAGSVAR